MKTKLAFVFGSVLAAMVALTGFAAMQEGVFDAGARLWPDPWFRATLADAYFGFLTIWLWIAWREGSAGPALLWLALFVSLGNIAIAVYLLWRIARAPREGTVLAVLLPERLRRETGW